MHSWKLLIEKSHEGEKVSRVLISSVAQSCLTPCDLMDCSMLGFSVHLQIPELAQTRVRRVGDPIQPSHPLSSPFPPAFNLYQHQSHFLLRSQFFTSGGQSIGVSPLASVLPMNIQDWFPLGLISLQSKGLSRVFFNTTVQKHLSFLCGPTCTSIYYFWKNHSFG